LPAVLVAAILTGIYIHSNRAPQPKTGTAKQHLLAPDFVLPQLNGTPLRLSSYRGRVVLLDFWATWCDPCREETPHFVELQQKYAGRGLQIIGVSMDDTSDPVRDFYRQFHMNYPVVMGDAKTGETYGGVLGLPIVFLLDRDGRIVDRHMGSTKAETFDQEIGALLPKQ
jgi:cytochrome c biogenesis protein CcmG, thiol:disulfide interchange protein DsbE